MADGEGTQHRGIKKLRLSIGGGPSSSLPVLLLLIGPVATLKVVLLSLLI